MKMEGTSTFTHRDDNHTLIPALFKCLTRTMGIFFWANWTLF
jgi:hypothetical protein